MMDWLGLELYRQFVIVNASIIEVFLSNILFNLKGKYRKHWWLFSLLSMAIIFSLSIPIAWVRMKLEFNRALQGTYHNIFLFLLNALLLFITYQNQHFQFLQTLCATHATRVFAANSLSSLLNLCGHDTSKVMFFFVTGNQMLNWMIYFAFHVAIYISFGFIFKEKEDINLSKSGKIGITLLLLFSIMGTDVISCFVSLYSTETPVLLGLVKLMLTLFSLKTP